MAAGVFPGWSATRKKKKKKNFQKNIQLQIGGFQENIMAHGFSLDCMSWLDRWKTAKGHDHLTAEHFAL